ncbi:hypothetical protein [Actinoplanes sp. RD1]|uniref:hypothetical protein n=1 Tax=Actinoplanes sp. RD1 TaxID=3064538 RepID=UPI002741B7E0|nr:hypothetical protein [Actinoplanes sp. RD1]
MSAGVGAGEYSSTSIGPKPLLGGGQRHYQGGAVGDVGWEVLDPGTETEQPAGDFLERRTGPGDQRHVEPLGREAPTDRVPRLRAGADDSDRAHSFVRRCAQGCRR